MDRAMLASPWQKGHLASFLPAAAVLAGLLAGSAAEEPATTGASKAAAVQAELRNLSDQPARGAMATFGQAFRKGDVPAGLSVLAAGRPVPAQVDVKRRYDDGSVRFAIITVAPPELPGGGKLALTLAPSPAGPAGEPIAPAELLKAGFDAVVRLQFPDGSARWASAAKMLAAAADSPATWLSGPLVTEWVLSGPPMDERGAPDEDLSVQFCIRACRRKAARVSLAVENCWDHWAGNIRYDVQVTVGGQEVFARKAVDHRPLSRWRKVFWWGQPPAQLHVVHDLAYLSASGALPHYDATLLPPPPRRPAAREGPAWEIMGQGSLTAYMPTTGGRPEIGPYPSWTVRALLTGRPEDKELVLANGDLAGSWPIHVRSSKRARQSPSAATAPSNEPRLPRIMTIDERPDFWLDERGTDRPQWKADRHAPDSKQVRLSPDIAHQPSLAYVPYLLTGDLYYLEEAYFWANFCLLTTWPAPRQKAKGILAGQIRGDAWGLRNLADAAWIAPGDHPEAAYFDQKVRNNIAERIQRMYGPPEYNKIGAWGIRTTADARIQNPANPAWMILAPWENDYLIWSLHHLVELGYADAARCRDFMLRLRVGSLTHSPEFDPMLACSYRFVVGEQTEGKKVLFYEDWAKLGEENAKLSKPSLPNYGNSYSYSARAAVVCGIDGGFPKADGALKWLEEHLADPRKVMAGDPVWAIVAGGAAAAGRPAGNRGAAERQ